MLGFLLVIGLAAFILFVGTSILRRRGVQIFDGQGRRVIGASRGPLRTLGVVVVGILIVLMLLGSVRVVPVGHALVIFNNVTKRIHLANQGVAFVAPFVSSTQLYDLRRLEYTMSQATGEGRKAGVDDSLWSPTREGLQVGIDLTVWHHLNPAMVTQIHQRIGPDYEEIIIRPGVRSVIRLVISEYPVMDVYSAKRAQIQDEINIKIKQLVEKDGFVIDEVILRDVRFTDDFTKAIEAKQIAQQSAEQMKYVLEKEKLEADRKVIEAKGRANAIETINAALRTNPNYIRYLYVDKLSDKISVIVSDQNTIMDMKGILDRAK